VSAGNDALACTREIDAGLETIEVRLPAVVTADLRLNEPRYVSLPGLMKARKKPIEVVTCAELGAAVQPRTQVVRTTVPPQRAAGARVKSVEELLQKLREEAKVI
jgi:electron transfer flavoprotein beta subunit